MKRDMDLVRNILLYLESKPDDQPCWGNELPLIGYEPLQLAYHANKLAEANLIVYEPSQTTTGRIIKTLVFSLSWSGHEYLDTIRDTAVWAETKKVAIKAGGFSLEILSAIAKQVVVTKVKEFTGFEINL